ncbi:hypothetical protein [Chromobacterium haemolyticum]|uniref:hypothetical protein n=1 Tax=Chromobacterium haemolyticum TaxID=394935 RepID=UPI00244A7D59|nr:hypothetical protein [Chromobacterium haemolyticum]MDH0342879.1 hypothetical protein [Chromobacterium haemolyticum]
MQVFTVIARVGGKTAESRASAEYQPDLYRQNALCAVTVWCFESMKRMGNTVKNTGKKFRLQSIVVESRKEKAPS